MNFMYALEPVLRQGNEAHVDSTHFTTDEVMRLVETFEFWGRRVDELKDLHKRSLDMLNDMQSSAAIGILHKKQKVEPQMTFRCSACGFVGKSKHGLTLHLKHCKLSVAERTGL